MEGLVVVISGFSGVGKGTIVRSLMERHPDEFAFSVSQTSRKPRDGEVDGREYFFVSRENFEENLKNRLLLEHTVYEGNYYGTPREFVENQLKTGVSVILEIEVEGALNAKAIYPEAYLIFIVPPKARDIYDRLKNRGSEPEEEIIRRMKKAAYESDFIGSYDDIIVNDDLETCIQEVYDKICLRKERLNRTHAEGAVYKRDFTELTKEEN